VSPPDAVAPSWFAALSAPRIVSGAPGEASDVSFDSRRVRAGGVFVAVPGFTVDGNDFIPAALANGAAYVVVEERLQAQWEPHAGAGATFIAIRDARVALAEAAAGLFGHPARTLGMVGVTGTDGKTTTSHLVAHVLSAAGLPCGLLSSVEFVAGAQRELNASHMTTVEAPDVQRRLAAMRDAGDRYAAVEASSIGLELHRVDQCHFDVGVFTNLSSDHLDFHQTMEAYGAAKAKLFGSLGEPADKAFARAAVLNADDPASELMRVATPSAVPVLRYSREASCEVRALDITTDGEGTRFSVHTTAASAKVRSPLFGDFNVSNCLAAISVAISQGVELQAAAQVLSSFPGVPGRMERIEEGQPFRVIVDIASTEQAMRNVLRVLRPVTTGRLIVVFGAAGERDRERRSGIARAVAGTGDYAILTNEDPRSEDPEAIIGEIAGALESHGWREGDRFARVPDRREALAAAFHRARAGDTVLLAGKGTEPSIVIGTTHHPWDERRVARELLRGRQPV
jgi:UDP-N-acetylmuramoyl-L-alanyl-D-glutamate--2,6-diaminopimelate ligase